jgi:hypothetical protein
MQNKSGLELSLNLQSGMLQGWKMSEFGGRMLFSGANYRRDHQVKVNPPMSEIQYLTRDDPANPCKKYRKNVGHAIFSRGSSCA